MQKHNKFNLEAFDHAQVTTIESYYLRACDEEEMNQPEFQNLVTEGHKPAFCSPAAAIGHCRRWLIEVRKKPQVASYFSKTIQENDVKVNLGSIVVKDTKIIPNGGSLDPAFSEAQPGYARDVANILLLHTTYKAENKCEEWITPAKAADLGIPYIPCAVARLFVNVMGNDNFITRDAMYEKLVSKVPADVCALLYCMSLIYTVPDMEGYTEDSPQYLAYYNLYKLPAFPPIKHIRVPANKCPGFKFPVSHSSIWWVSIKSIQALGEGKKRGVVTTGYYRFDMPSSEVKMMEEATDLIMICRRYKFKAVRTVSMNQTLYSILVKNGISVYTTHSGLRQPKNKIGVWSGGTEKCFLWGVYKQEAPKLLGDTVTLPPPIVVDGRTEPFFNYVYIPEASDSQLRYLPSIGAASGYCIATNVPVGDGVSLHILMKRFCQALVFRNLFPYTRLTYVNQDCFRTWFTHAWIFPKKKERTVRDVFAGIIEEAVDYKILDDDCKLMSLIRPTIPEPTPKLIGENELLKALPDYNDDALKYALIKVNEGRVALDDNRLSAIYAVMDTDRFIDVIQGELRERELVRRKDPNYKPDTSQEIISPGGFNCTIPENAAPAAPSLPAFDPFAGVSATKVYYSDDVGAKPDPPVKVEPPATQGAKDKKKKK